ncbi:aminotransferase class V-fold PLP-dependent enzyme [Nocardioides humilatus]|uniref:Aminotransferase class V-fold PLP-dependent enzyme n=1 Tax=Nocardioides humilatus TaxID=2607660 RepID=A0A5B1LBF5_9ACTN|nr:aminotransferase class V-fold PLP-dependent enzyme [Nocardioides humilatus]KAA1417992.1 aminotransferase class V-fold PLP-dependent enzyme [Nocardioides humilatus]
MTGPPGYLDTASAEPLHPAARETLLAALERGYADPRRLHGAGRDARLLLDNARAVVAECLGARPDEVGFTASGSEAVHRGLLGLLAAGSGGGIVHSAVEHSSVLHAAQWHASPAHVSVAVDSAARVDLDAMSTAARRPGVGVVALQAANQEVGTRQPVDDLDLPDDLPLFVDAAAAIGRMPLPTRWSALAGSAHKWGGPSGVGVLVVRRSTRWTTPFPGDDGLDHLGASVPAALAAAAALQAVLAEREETAARQHRQVDRIRACAAALPDTEVVGDPVERLPHLVTFSCLYISGDELVTGLDRRGFAVASGSACTASTLEPSHVLAAMGALTHGNVRVSLRRDTTDDEVERFCTAVTELVTDIRSGIGL